MRRVVAVLVSAVAALGMLAPPVFAQAPAAPPAPKVTISGLVDFVTTLYKNWSGGSGVAGNDITDGGKDQGWYSRERGVFTITGEIGKSKGVLALEFDLVNGFIGTTPQTGVLGGGGAFPGTTASLDLDTDVTDIPEVKWLYVETPLTGPGSLMPFIPAPSIVRAGGQPARGHDYKPGIQFSGDFPGVTVETQWAPNVKSTLTYAQLREATDKVLAPGVTESWALLASVELEVFKGLTVKPTYSYTSLDGGTGNSSLGSPAVDGLNVNGTNLRTTRHTIGGDVRWTAGPWSLQPTFLFQWGEQECVAGAGGCTVTKDIDITAWIADVIGGFRTGPLTIEARAMWTSGNSANERPRNGDDINYYTPINPGFSYLAGWSEIWTSGIVDYITALFAGIPGISARTSPSYDKYGRIFVGLAADYALTPAFVLHGIANASWTPEKVDTDGATLTSSSLVSSSGGDHRYLGTEVGAGFTYRFAPNVAFDLIGAYLFAGDALNHTRTGGTEKDADDVYKVSSRVRVTW